MSDKSPYLFLKLDLTTCACRVLYSKAHWRLARCPVVEAQNRTENRRWTDGWLWSRINSPAAHSAGGRRRVWSSSASNQTRQRETLVAVTWRALCPLFSESLARADFRCFYVDYMLAADEMTLMMTLGISSAAAAAVSLHNKHQLHSSPHLLELLSHSPVDYKYDQSANQSINQ